MEIDVIRCPNCGGNVNFGPGEDTVYCDYCNSLLGIERDAGAATPVLIHSSGKYSGAFTQAGSSGRSTPPQSRALFYMISLIAPVAGFIFAAQYWRGDESSKSFAKVCLLLALANFAFEAVFIGVAILISLIAGAG